MTKLQYTPIGKTMRIKYDLDAIEDTIAALVKAVYLAVSRADVVAEIYLENGGAT
jgi:hypothetical protein